MSNKSRQVSAENEHLGDGGVIAAHTPGPWNIDGSFDAEIAVAIYAGDMDADWNGICELEPIGEDWTPEEIANAHLIAAAPDLLRVTREMCRIIAFEVNDLEGAIRRIYADARAAIDKAEGRASEECSRLQSASSEVSK